MSKLVAKPYLSALSSLKALFHVRDAYASAYASAYADNLIRKSYFMYADAYDSIDLRWLYV